MHTYQVATQLSLFGPQDGNPMLLSNVSAACGMRGDSKERGCTAWISISVATSKADSAFAAASLAPHARAGS